MPAISTGKVLVTGANGYVAAWVVKALLEQGFAVRGTVRSDSKANHLRSLFKSYGDKLEFTIVDDIVKVSRPIRDFRTIIPSDISSAGGRIR